MREYKFRGKRKDNGEWVYGDLLHGQGKTFIAIGVSYITHANHVYVVPNDWYEVDPDTVGQYTEIPDKNKNEICEGDVIKIFCNRNWDWVQAVVEYENGTYFANAERFHVSLNKLVEMGAEFEVIGNKWDNPELLKEGSV